MCCETGKSSWGHHGSFCCCPPYGYPRRFLTKEEEIARLEEYRRELKNELNALDIRIKEEKEGD